MAVGFSNYPNRDTSEPGKFPQGAIRDNDGSNNGTPVTRQTYGDIHQFFVRLMALAGISPSGTEDNAVDGYQYDEALVGRVRLIGNSETEAGCARRATQGETNAGTNVNAFISPAKLANTPTVLHVDGSTIMRRKKIDIGAWNMATTATASVAHGIADFKKIHRVTARIRNDANNVYEPLDKMDSSTFEIQGGVFTTGSTSVILVRRTSGYFDDSAFSTTTGSYNRGFLIIDYED